MYNFLLISALTPDFSTPSLPSVSSVSILSETPPPPSPASAVSAFLLRPPTPPKRADVILERSLIEPFQVHKVILSIMNKKAAASPGDIPMKLISEFLLGLLSYKRFQNLIGAND